MSKNIVAEQVQHKYRFCGIYKIVCPINQIENKSIAFEILRCLKTHITVEVCSRPHACSTLLHSARNYTLTDVIMQGAWITEKNVAQVEKFGFLFCLVSLVKGRPGRSCSFIFQDALSTSLTHSVDAFRFVLAFLVEN